MPRALPAPVVLALILALGASCGALAARSQPHASLRRQQRRASDTARVLVPPSNTHPDRVGHPPGTSDAVLHLPGLPNTHSPPSRHFAGHIEVDEASGRRLFYYLVTSEAPQPEQSPLLLWLTGGPGCSSLDAFTYENGPFTFAAPAADAAGRAAGLGDIELTPNPHSWSKVAHVLYVDSPAGTGFSYTPGTQRYHTNDRNTIEDLAAFVGGFYARHPELARQRLYIAGESYGGVYVPLLARRLLEHNRRVVLSAQQRDASGSGDGSGSGNREPQPYPLAGYVVGNGVTDDETDAQGQLQFAFGHGLIDPAMHKRVRDACEPHNWAAKHGPCAEAFIAMEAAMGDINQYDITGSCFKPAANTAPSKAAAGTAGSGGGSAARRVWPHAPVFPEAVPLNSAGTGLVGHTISCADRRLALIYYNSPEVRHALHAPSQELSGGWEPCSDRLHYTHEAGSMVDVHAELLDAGLQALVLSGDQDYVVPFTGTRAWVYGLGLRESKPWHAWSLPGDDQVAGFAVQFGGLTFATVKGGGHMVPQTQPAASLALLQQWLEDSL